MKRVLQVLGTTNLGGAESRVMDLYRHMNRDEIQFDFLVHHRDGYFEKEIREMGGNVYYLPSFRIYNFFNYKRTCYEFFREHSDYIAVHGHMTSTAAIYLPIAKACGIPLTIAHARSAGVDPGLKGILTKWMRRKLWKHCDIAIACSDLAGQAVFGNHDFYFMPNGIDTKEFQKNEQKREEVRRKLGLEENFVIGHVGRFDYAKNHGFLIDIFSEIVKLDANSNPKLLLLGEGGSMKEMKEKVKKLGIEKDVLFLGNQRPVEAYYQAMDTFVFPSFFEGMPGTVIEAEAAGLPCFISDRITKQVKATNEVYFLSLEKAAKEWAEEIIEKRDKLKRKSNPQEIQLTNSFYDVNKQVEFYEKLYLKKE